MTMRIGLDRGLCDGNGLCAQAAPEYFRLDEDDALSLPIDTVAEADLPQVRRAVDICPKAALSLRDDAAG